ncbi:MAG: FkbM family methyltransferase [Paludibaculum sp.]
MKGLAPGSFWREARRAARLAASPGDRAVLWACQVAHSLRYRVPALVSSLKLEPSIRSHGSVLRTPIRFSEDDWLAFQQVFIDEEYRWDGNAPRTILDAGANCGFATLWLASRFPDAQLCSVEPHPKLAASLRRALTSNSVRSTVVEAALTPSDGKATLFQGALSTAHSLLAGMPLGGSGTLEVDTVSMPSLLERLGWQQVDLLKLDIEGGEAAVLAGSPAWLQRVGGIVGEIHGAYTPQRLSADLKPAGFRVETRGSRQPYLFTATR